MTALAGLVSKQPTSVSGSTDSGPRTLGVKPSTRWEELTPGLLIFFARPSRLQSWAERWGHPWRHVGVTVQTPDGMRVASYSAKNCYRIDDLEALMPNYNRIGVASIGATREEAEVMSAWCASFENLARKEAPYTKTAFAIGPLLAIARRKTGVVREFLLAILLMFCLFEERLARRRPGFICSTFAWQAIEECTAHTLRLPLSAHPDDQAAYATPVTPRDQLLARWLCGPGDLWFAVSESHRCELELDHLIDLNDLDDVIDLRVEAAAPARALAHGPVAPFPDARSQAKSQTPALRRNPRRPLSGEIPNTHSRAKSTRGFRSAAALGRAAFALLVFCLPISFN